MKHFIALSLIVVVFMSNSPAQASDEEAIKSFDAYIEKCPEDEIRCVWFLNGSVRVGMVMKLDLSAYEAFTVREVHDWAHQSQKTRKLSHSQIATLKKLLQEMPKSTKSEDRLSLVFVSYYQDGKLEVKKYLRHDIPREVERIYDIGGGYLDTTQGEQGGTDQPAPAPASDPEVADDTDLSVKYDLASFEMEFSNNTDAEIKILRPLDGSEWCWIYPYYRFEITDSKEIALKAGPRCKNFGFPYSETKWPDVYLVVIPPNGKKKVNVAPPMLLKEGESYTVTVKYIFSGEAKGTPGGAYPEGLWIGTTKSNPAPNSKLASNKSE